MRTAFTSYGTPTLSMCSSEAPVPIPGSTSQPSHLCRLDTPMLLSTHTTTIGTHNYRGT